MRFRKDKYWVITDLNEGYWACDKCNKPLGQCRCPEEVREYEGPAEAGTQQGEVHNG